MLLYAGLLPRITLTSERTFPIRPGLHHHLLCNATQNSFPEFEISWLDPSGQVIDSSNLYFAMRNVEVNGTFISNELTFNHLLTSQAGQYTCIVNMTIPGLITDFSGSKTINVIVQCEYASYV